MKKRYFFVFLLLVQAMLLKAFVLPPPPDTVSIISLETKNVFLSQQLPFTDTKINFACNKTTKISLKLVDSEFKKVNLLGGQPNPVSNIECGVNGNSYVFEGIHKTGAYIVIAQINPAENCVKCIARSSFAVIKVLDRKVDDLPPNLAFFVLLIVMYLLLKK